MIRTASLLTLVLALSGCAPRASGPTVAAAGPRQCFSPSSVSGYVEAGEEAVNIRVGASAIWRLQLEGSCPGLKWSRALLLQQNYGGSVCSGGAVDVLVDDAGVPRRCLVRSVERLTLAQIEALPPGQKP